MKVYNVLLPFATLNGSPRIVSSRSLRFESGTKVEFCGLLIGRSVHALGGCAPITPISQTAAAHFRTLRRRKWTMMVMDEIVNGWILDVVNVDEIHPTEGVRVGLRGVEMVGMVSFERAWLARK